MSPWLTLTEPLLCLARSRVRSPGERPGPSPRWGLPHNVETRAQT